MTIHYPTTPTLTIYHAAFFSLVYANSLLATLNARKSIHGQGGYTDSNMSLKAMGKGSSGQSTGPHNVNVANSRIDAPPHNIAIQIETTREYMEDHKSEVQELDMDVGFLVLHCQWAALRF